ncbi:PAS domain S-box protein [Massilia sp. LXY-6]|uniref:PAS domain S-box protein n=1 Tax=Massilia sp. LXY-6 TaxID=3379823 RepID=UPI003EE236A0
MADSSIDTAVGYRDDAVIAALLHGRGAHLQGRDPGAERAALAGLAQYLADDPEVLLQRVAEAVRALCGASSVVIAVREPGPDGDEIYWCATAGGLAAHAGKRFPVEACPCGASVVGDCAVLFLRPELEFASIRSAGIRVGEALGVPWRVRGHPAGALMAMLDGDGENFDADDLQLLRELAGFAAAAYQTRGALRGNPDPERLERELEQRLRPVLESKESLEREVEESRAAERALREHKALIDATLSISTVGVVYFDLDGTVREVNQAYQRMTGYSEDELRRLDSWKAVTSPEFWDRTLRSGNELLETGVTRPYTKQMLRKDGSRWWGLYAPARISGEGEHARCVCFILDVTELKETESRLAESEERFRSLVEGFGQAVWETDQDAKLVVPSPSWCAYTGQREAASLGKGWLDAVHPDDREYVQREWRAALAMRRAINMEYRVHVAMGGWRWTNARAAPLFNPDGSLCKWFGMNIDIDERRRTQAALAESERRYRMLFEAMDEGFLMATVQFDANGRAVGLAYLEANPAAVRMISIHYVGPGQLKVRPEHEPCWLEACAQVARTGANTRSQCFADALSSWFDFFVYPVGGDAGAPRVAILFRDITVRKRAEDALRESEARFRALADASPALIYQFDPDGSLMYLNQRGPHDDGPAAETGGWRAIVQPDDMHAYLREVCDGIRERAAYNQRIRVAARDGSWRWFESHAAPWYSGEGEHRGYVGISLDITGAVQAEEALREADRRKDEFLATLAHELRNPLAPISNAVQLMRRPDGRRQADRVVEMVGRQVRQIVTLVDDLMEVSRITRGKIDLRLERVPIAEIVHSAVETSQLAIERAGHQLALALPEEPLVLLADRVRLTQVFANLLNNAAKYTDAGGRIWVDVWREGGQVLASVRDTGIGIPPEALGRVFDMFAQAHRAVGRGQGGLGIGLTMVRSLVEMHHGTVEARSGGSGQGSEFLVRLPLAPQDEAMERPGMTQARPNAPFAGQRVLVVDDNRDAADTLGLLLEADGAEVRVVYDGRAALAMAEAFLPSSVLLDIGMPGMDGYEVARRLRQDERFASMRIIALTGWGQDSDRRQTRNRGFTYHLTKPVSLEELHKILT